MQFNYNRKYYILCTDYYQDSNIIRDKNGDIKYFDTVKEAKTYANELPGYGYMVIDNWTSDQK